MEGVHAITTIAFAPSIKQGFFCKKFMWFLTFSVANQEYRVDVHLESVILYNDVIFKCNIQSFVADFVSVIGWVDSEGDSHASGSSLGNCIVLGPVFQSLLD